MFVDVRLQSRIVLRNRRVCRDVRVVILIRASYQRHAHNRVLVLRQRVQRTRLLFLRRQQQLNLLRRHAHLNIHLPIRLTQIVLIRLLRRKPQQSLCPHHALGRRRDVRIRRRDHVDVIREILAHNRSHAAPNRERIRLVGQILPEQIRDVLQFAAKRPVAALQRRRLQAGRRLHQRHGRAYRRVLTALTDRNLRRVRQIPGGLIRLFKQRQGNLRRLLVRHRHDRILDRHASGIDLAELRRTNTDVIVLQLHALNAQAAREVIQRARINQLATDRRRRLRRIPQQVRVTQPVEPNAGHELIVRERIVPLERRVHLVVVPIDRQNLPRPLFNRHNIRQRDAIFVLKPNQIQIRIDLVNPILFGALSTRFHALNAVHLRLNRRL